MNVVVDITSNVKYESFFFWFPVSGLHRSPSIDEVARFHHKITNYKVCQGTGLVMIPQQLFSFLYALSLKMFQGFCFRGRNLSKIRD